MRALLYTGDVRPFLEPELLSGLQKKLGKNNVFLYKPQKYIKAGIQSTQHNLMSSTICDELDHFDYIFIFYSAFQDKNFEHVLNKQTSSLKIFVDGLDDFFIRRIYNHPEIRYYLKRELFMRNLPKSLNYEWRIRYLYEAARHINQPDYRWELTKWNHNIGIAYQDRYNKTIPFQLTIAPPPRKGDPKRIYDIFFIGHINTRDRRKYINALKRFSELNACVPTNSRNPDSIIKHTTYIRKLRLSKAGLSIRGIGYDTVRYWEIPAYGATLLSQKTPLMIPHDFCDNESALYFDSEGTLRRKIERYIIKSDEWREIARAGKENFFKYHTPEKRVSWLLKHIKQ